jgi:toxin-antitoxin system PIN domain toxin
MILPDTNILVYAHRKEAPRHKEYERWIDEYRQGNEAYGLSELVLSSFLRIVTNPKIYKDPTPIKAALGYVAQLREPAHAVIVSPGARHWKIFTDLCERVSAKGNLVPDAYLAALAIESGNEWITHDHDYSRFPGLRWRHPLE